MSLLDSWSRGEHTADGVTHPTYRKGSGPGVIVIHEIPGLTPEVIRFAEEVVAAGFTVILPHLFGTPEAPTNAKSLLKVFPRVCVSKEFTTLATGRASPVTRWLRSLASSLHDELGGPGSRRPGHVSHRRLRPGDDGRHLGGRARRRPAVAPTPGGQETRRGPRSARRTTWRP